MSSSYSTGYLDDLANIRTVPAAVSGAFLLLSLYAYGGVSSVELVWVGYTLEAGHALIGSLVVYLIAFMSSESNDFESYDQEEQALIVAGPASMLGWEYVPMFHDAVASLGDPLGQQVLFALSIVSWAVIVR